jgi:hypothetical protein
MRRGLKKLLLICCLGTLLAAVFAGGAAASAAPSASGCSETQTQQWNLTGENEFDVAYDGAAFVYDATFSQEGSCLDGTLNDSYYPTSGPISGTLTGDSVTIVFDYPAGSVQGTRTYTGTISQSGAVSGSWTQTGDESPDNGTWTLEEDATEASCDGASTGTGAAQATASGVQVRHDDDEGAWAGYDVATSRCAFTKVTGQWIQPAVTCPKKYDGLVLEADFWVGLDGANNADGTNSGTVEQTGIEVTCRWFFGYHLTYSAWYEMYPAGPVYFSGLDPRAGSEVKAVVIYDGDNQYDLNLAVTTDGVTRTGNTEQACEELCANSTAEWIAEKVKGRNLAHFKPWVLTDGTATTSDGTEGIQSLGATPDVIKPGNTVLAFPDGLNGSTMRVVWVRS